jgi:serine phosphatase RsbU (regulator of sigma subunit)
MEFSFETRSLFIIPPLLSFLIGITLALTAVIRGRLKLENVLFALVCLWWSMLMPLFISHHFLWGKVDTIMKIERGVHFFYVYLPAINALYFFRMTGTRSRVILPGSFILSFLVSLTTFTDYYLVGLNEYSWGYISRGGIMLQVFGLYSALMVIYFIVSFIRRIRTEKNRILRLKLLYIVLSFILVGLLTLTNLPAMNGIDFYPLGNLMFLPLAFLGYGVLSNRLMDIRSVLHVTFIWGAMSSLILIPNIALFYFVSHFIGSIGAVYQFMIGTAWFIGNYFYFKRVQPLIDQLFNRRKYNLNAIESSFIDSISTLKTLGELIDQFTEVIRKTIGFRSAEMVLCRPDEPVLAGAGLKTCALDPGLEAWFVRSNHLVDHTRVEARQDYPEREALLALFRELDAAYLVPLVLKGRLFILLVLTEKQNLRQITNYEVRFINNIRAAAAIALDNSVMYGNLTMLTEQLEHKVEERTAELKKAMDALWGEMELAKKIQTTLLPRLPAIRGFEIAAYMQPADQVGGDYYDIINAEGLDWLVIGDVSGHGVPAGLIMMMVQTAIHMALAARPNLRPDVLLNRVNNVITENIQKLDEDRYMTITVIACMSRGRFIFSGQHQHIMMYRAALNDVELIETNGIWIGIAEELKKPATGEFAMEVGDTLMLYTDGITDAWRQGSTRDQRNPSEDMFGIDRLRKAFRKLGTQSPADIKEGILSDLKGYYFNDDVTMVIMKRLE